MEAIFQASALSATEAIIIGTGGARGFGHNFGSNGGATSFAGLSAGGGNGGFRGEGGVGTGTSIRYRPGFTGKAKVGDNAGIGGLNGGGGSGPGGGGNGGNDGEDGLLVMTEYY